MKYLQHPKFEVQMLPPPLLWLQNKAGLFSFNLKFVASSKCFLDLILADKLNSWLLNQGGCDSISCSATYVIKVDKSGRAFA